MSPTPHTPSRRSVEGYVKVPVDATIVEVPDHARVAACVRIGAWLHVALLGLVGLLVVSPPRRAPDHGERQQRGAEADPPRPPLNHL